jgi:uncharacterized protein (TIGR02145 family)
MCYDYNGTSVTDAKATDNYKTYGVLYNWPAAKAACPPGWHLPTDAEWTALENYLIANGYNYDGTTTEIKSQNRWQHLPTGMHRQYWRDWEQPFVK